MKAYKAFGKDLSCLGYKFELGTVNITAAANCVRNGFHCAENPIDCLAYYSNWNSSVYYLVEAGGDLDEDGRDSKLSCTELTLIKQLDLYEFTKACMEFVIRCPMREYGCNHSKVSAAKDIGKAGGDSGILVRGKRPAAAGRKGAVLALLREQEESIRIAEAQIITIDRDHYKTDTYYTLINGEIREVSEP